MFYFIRKSKASFLCFSLKDFERFKRKKLKKLSDKFLKEFRHKKFYLKIQFFERRKKERKYCHGSKEFCNLEKTSWPKSLKIIIIEPLRVNFLWPEKHCPKNVNIPKRITNKVQLSSLHIEDLTFFKRKKQITIADNFLISFLNYCIWKIFTIRVGPCECV